MKASLVPLVLLSVASASPLNFFGRNNDHPAPAPSKDSDVKDCKTHGVQIVSKEDGKCLQPYMKGSDDKDYSDKKDDKEDDKEDKKHRRNNDHEDKKAEISEGTKVVAVDCKDAPYLWDLPKKEGGPVTLSAYPHLAIDAGRHPADGGHLSLYKTNGTPQQQWIINDHHQIQLKDGKQCVDLGDKGLQTYTCYKGNKNQEFEAVPVNCPKTSAPAKGPETVYKTETKYEAKPTTVYQPKYETQYETKYETKYDTKYETKYETKTQPAVTVQAPAQTVYKTETKYDTKYETKTQPAVTVTAPAQTVYKTEYKTETKTQPAVTVTAPAQTVYKTETKYVDKPTTIKVTETVKASGKPTTLTVIHEAKPTQSAGAGYDDKSGGNEHEKEGQDGNNDYGKDGQDADKDYGKEGKDGDAHEDNDKADKQY